MLLTTAVLLSLGLLIAGQRIDVAVCNTDRVNESVISKAEVEAEAVYRRMHIEIVWHACGSSLASPQTHAPSLVIRVRNDKPPTMVGPASLDVMGKAHVEGHSGGTMADVYIPAIRATAEEHAADPSVLLGFVMAHELGHLLLGPGHTPGGVMQAVWGQKEIAAAGQRWLRFSKESAKQIQLVVEVRAAAAAQRMAHTLPVNESTSAVKPHHDQQ